MVTNEKDIKSALLARLRSAHKVLGRDWQSLLARHDPEFDSLDGARLMRQASVAISTDDRRIGIDRLSRVVNAMEELAGIESEKVVI